MKNNKYHQSNRQKPLRTFSWSKNDLKTPTQELIGETVEEWYDAKHRSVSSVEVSFINSIEIKRCPYCGSSNIFRNGKRKSDGIQKYCCKSCGRSFNPMTNTIFVDRKIPISEWIEYLLHLFEYHSITSSAFDNRNANSTGKYWLEKVFAVLKNVQNDVILEGRIYIDETYLPKIKSQTIFKDGKKLRGISQNKIGVDVAITEDGSSSILISTERSKPSRKSTWNGYGPHIKEGSTIIHDGDNSHDILVERLHLNSEVYPTEKTKGLKDEENPLYRINHYHYFLKRFMKAHGGYDRDNLQDWLNLFWFITNGPEDRYDKVLKFIEMAISAPKVVRYRDALLKKNDK